jgi:hypothetical protein
MLGVDLGFWAFGAGTVVGILGAQLLAKELRPPDPDLLEGALTPDDFSAFPVGRAAPAPAPMVPIPPTLPAEAITDAPAHAPAHAPGLDDALAGAAASDEAPAGAAPAEAPAGDADSPGDAAKPG